jgi:hypothetical protein
VSSSLSEPSLRFLLPASNENRWTDLLASFIETDPQPLAKLLNLAGPFGVHREVSIIRDDHREDRLDLLLTRRGDDSPLAVIEAKVLSDLGRRQLDRYRDSFPGAESYAVLHLQALPVGAALPHPWQPLAWETVLDAYSRSEHPWVSLTARAWQTQLHALVPSVDARTVWNAVPDSPRDFELALRARMVWLATAMNSWCDLAHDLVQSSAGGSWVSRMWQAIPGLDHVVSCEVEEGMTAQAWRPNPHRPYSERMVGPSVWVGLRQDDVDTSANFDWQHLIRVFRHTILDEEDEPTDDRHWLRTRPNLRDPGDRKRWEDAGAPMWLGKGFGMAQAVNHRGCMFGARYLLTPTTTLGEIDQEMRRLQGLIEQMAAVPYPSPAQRWTPTA